MNRVDIRWIVIAGLGLAAIGLWDLSRLSTDISQWEAIGRAHGEVFGHIRPATAMVEVSRLIDPALLVEIELDAVLGSAEAG